MVEYFKFDEKLAGLFIRLGVLGQGDLDFGKLRDVPQSAREIGSLIGRMRAGIPFDVWCDTIPTVSNAVFILTLFNENSRLLSAYAANGSTASILGTPITDQKALIVHDILSAENSPLAQIRLLEKSGLKVEHLIFLVDSEDGYGEVLGEMGYKIRAGFRLSELREYYARDAAQLREKEG